MKVIVCGAGQVGYNIARYPAGAGNDVTVIDQRPELTQKIGESLDIQAITGFASHPEVLEQAGAEDAEVLIAVTYADEVNMIACQVAHSLFNVPTKIARIRHQSYLQSRWQDLFRRERLPIDVIISPEQELARAIGRRLEVPGATEVTPFAEDRVRLIATRCGPDCPILDTPLRQLTFLFPDLHLTCVGITRGDRFFIPTGDDHLIAGDEVYSVVETSHVGRALRVYGHDERIAGRIVITGGGNVGLFLAQQLEASRPDVSITIVESNPERARFVADKLARTVVLNGDARDPEIHEEAGLRAAEAIVCVTNDDEVNIMAALLAKRLGCPQALTLVNNNAYAPLLGSLGVDVMINPRDTTVSSILQHVRRGRIKSAHTLRDGEAEVFEAEALETSPLVGQSLEQARLPSGVIIGAILRDDEMILPRAETVIRPRDRVIVVARAAVVKKVEKLFAVRLDISEGRCVQRSADGTHRLCQRLLPPAAECNGGGGGSRLPVRRRRLRGDRVRAGGRATSSAISTGWSARSPLSRSPRQCAPRVGERAVRDAAPEPARRRSPLSPDHARHRAAQSFVPQARPPLAGDHRASAGLSRRTRARGGGRRDHPARPALGALRHQVDQPIAQRPRPAERGSGRLSRGLADRPRGHGDRGVGVQRLHRGCIGTARHAPARASAFSAA